MSNSPKRKTIPWKKPSWWDRLRLWYLRRFRPFRIQHGHAPGFKNGVPGTYPRTYQRCWVYDHTLGKITVACHSWWTEDEEAE